METYEAALLETAGAPSPASTLAGAADKPYCVYIAPDVETVRQHAERGGFPANKISEVRDIIDPTTAETPR